MLRPRNLVLTGFMGTGKTTVGRIVAEKIGFVFVDSDEMIEEAHGPIPDIFSEKGEAAFREIERTVARRLAEEDRQVIATGGGMVVDPESRAALRSSSLIICLTASPEEIQRRISAEPTARGRPMLSSGDPGDRIRSLLAERSSVYSQFDHVATDGRTPGETAEEVIRLWNHLYPA